MSSSEIKTRRASHWLRDEHRSRWYLGLLLAVIALAVVTFVLYVRAEAQIGSANELRFQSQLLSSELRQSSDDLSKFVRLYAVTGDPRYKDYFQEVLDIRDGKAARPIDYHYVYWDLVLKDDRRPRPRSAMVPLLELMRQANFTAAEFLKLQEAKTASDRLTQTEFRAFALIDGTTRLADPNRLEAIAILHDEGYFQAKAAVMNPIAEFELLVSERTKGIVLRNQQIASYLRWGFVLCSLLLGVVVWKLLQAINQEHGARTDADNLFRNVFENAGVGLAWISPEGNFINVNQALCEMLGYTRDKFLLAGSNYQQFVCQQDLDRQSESTYSILVADSNLPTVNRRYLHKDGHWVWARLLLRCYRDGTGRALYFIAALSDISQQIRADQEATRNQQSLRAVIEGAMAGTWVLSLQTNVIAINNRWSEILGYDMRELEPMDLSKLAALTHPDDMDAAQSLMSQHLNGNAPQYHSVTRLRHKDGHWVWIESRGKVSARGGDGKSVAMAGTIQDISLAHEAELELKNAKLLAESANKAKSDFLANVNHEIRTQLNSIMGMAQLLERHRLPPEQEKMANGITSASKGLLSIVDNILDFSKIEAGQMKVENTAFDCLTLLDEINVLYGASARQKGLSLQLDTNLSGPMLVIGDRLRISQVLNNLVSNAIKFTERGTVNVSVISRPAATSAVSLHFAVSDTGCGIDAATLKGLFAPFTHADNGISRRHGGTGLGLAISKRLVELMGSTILVESTPGKGSKFSFELHLPDGLPATKGNKGQQAKNSQTPARLAGLRILIADDNLLNLELLQQLMLSEKAVPTCVANGQLAVEYLRAHPADIDMVLMDVHMPVLDGIEAASVMRRELGLSQLPIITISAGLQEDKRKAMQIAGVNDFVPKPADIEVIVETLLRWWKRS